MAILQETFVQSCLAESEDFRQVELIRDSLFEYLNHSDSLAAIEVANKPRANSAEIQSIFLDHAQSLGFRSEAKGLFSDYATPGLRPDYYKPLGDTGILIEVERGKTTINNMDFLDLWKCHVCPVADYLFLMVPQALIQNETMRPRKEYATVVKRMSTFFTDGNYTNVRALTVFGY